MTTIPYGQASEPRARASAASYRGNSTDAADLHRIVACDASGVAGLYDRHSAMVFGLALRVTNDHGLAEDVVQETFVSVWQGAASFDNSKASARTWILTIAHRRAVDAVRRRRRPVMSLDLNQVDVPLQLPAAPDVWTQVSTRLDGATVQRALAELPEAQRHSLQLAYYSGLTQQEIAAAMRVPLGTVKGRVRLGLVRLRELLSPADDEYEAAVQGS